MSTVRATSTSYAVLGLLAIRSWTAYELARQADRSLRWFFPRAERAVYLEAKRLVVLGWAEAERVLTGRRPGTRYHITGAGRRALREWTGEPSAAPSIESEAVLKLFVGDRTDPAVLLRAVRETATGAASARRDLAALAEENLNGLTEFDERVDLNVLSLRFMADMQQAIAKWAEWAEQALSDASAIDPAARRAHTEHALEQIARRG